MAAPCAALVAPIAADYDAWESWVTGTLLRAYADCAAKHDAIVAAWPK